MNRCGRLQSTEAHNNERSCHLGSGQKRPGAMKIPIPLVDMQFSKRRSHVAKYEDPAVAIQLRHLIAHPPTETHGR